MLRCWDCGEEISSVAHSCKARARTGKVAHAEFTPADEKKLCDMQLQILQLRIDLNDLAGFVQEFLKTMVAKRLCDEDRPRIDRLDACTRGEK